MPFDARGVYIRPLLTCFGISAAFFSAWGAKKLRGLSYGAGGAHGNGATRIESFFVGGAPYTSGGYPDIDELARAQAGDLDRGKREQMLHQIQRLAYDRAETDG